MEIIASIIVMCLIFWVIECVQKPLKVIPCGCVLEYPDGSKRRDLHKTLDCEVCGPVLRSYLKPKEEKK